MTEGHNAGLRHRYFRLGQQISVDVGGCWKCVSKASLPSLGTKLYATLEPLEEPFSSRTIAASLLPGDYRESQQSEL